MSPDHPATGPLTPAELAQDARLYRDTLNTLAQIGADLATALHKEIMAIPTGAPGAIPKLHTLSADFDRIARAIRRTILLVLSLSRPARPPAAAKPAAEPDPTETEKPEAAERPESEPRERLDRMDAPERADDLTKRPFAAIVAEIARDLGVPVPEMAATLARSPTARPDPNHHPAPGKPGDGPVTTLSHLPTRRPDG